MRVFAVFILALAVLYGGLCATGAKSIALLAQTVAPALDAAAAASPCHSVPPSDAVPDAPVPDVHCCEISSVFAVSSGVALDADFLLGASHFFVIDAAPPGPIVREFAMAETTVERTAFPELRILYARFLI